MFFFALALCLSATVVNAQTSANAQPLTEQEMSNINPSSWNQTTKTAVKTRVNICFGTATGQPPTSLNDRIGITLYNSLTAQQKQAIQPSSSSSRPSGPGRTSTMIACSTLKYADFWSALELCKQ